MPVIATAIVPIVVLLALGAILRRTALTDPAFWRGLEWLSYRIFTPALFIHSIAGADLSGVSLPLLLTALGAPITGIAILLVLTRRLWRSTGPQLTSLIQGSVRINTYIGLVFASALTGSPGVARFAIASAVVVPLVNIICVSSLARHGRPDAGVVRRPLWRELVGNPLIQSCVLGIALNLAGIGLPEPVAAPLELLAAPALVAGTLISGAAITFDVRLRDLLDVGISSALKLVTLPIAAAGIASAAGADPLTLTAIVIITAVPTAPSAVVLASRMGGDVRLIASITGAQTILAMITMPLVIDLLTPY